jgi:hypothetical protein
MSIPEELVVIVQYFGSHALFPALRLSVISSLSLAICLYGPGSRTEAAGATSGASTSVEAKAVIHRRVELRQDGSVISDSLDGNRQMQVDAHECDPEIRSRDADCVFLIYEIQ